MSLQLNDQSVLAIYNAQKQQILDTISLDQMNIDAAKSVLEQLAQKYPNDSVLQDPKLFYHQAGLDITGADWLAGYNAEVTINSAQPDLYQQNKSLSNLSSIIDQQTKLVQNDISTQNQLQSINNVTSQNGSSSSNPTLLDKMTKYAVPIGIGLTALGIIISLAKRKRSK